MGLAHHLIFAPASFGNLLISLMVAAWGIRLGGYLFWTRVRLGKKDARYESLKRSEAIPVALNYLIHYAVQACFQAAVGLVFIFTSAITDFSSIWTTLGVVLWAIGFIGCAAADHQLHRFRKNISNHGHICRNGLWNYSRHPNYFFEICLWYGFSAIALSCPLGWLGLISPTVLMLTMVFITGPISENQSLKSRPDAYRQYQKTTSMIIPWFRYD
jgi:steroid 5-alpha reductase family enzyme